MKEKLIVRLGHFGKVFEGHASLVFFIPFFDSFVKHLGTGLKIDDQVWFRHPGVQERVDLLVKIEFLGAQGERRKNLVLGEQIIGNDVLIEQIMLRQLDLLLVAVEQKKRLVLKRVGLAGFIKFRRKRIVFDPLKDGPGLEFIG